MAAPPDPASPEPEEAAFDELPSEPPVLDSDPSPPEPPLDALPEPPPQAATEADAAPTPRAAASRMNVSRDTFSKMSSSSPADTRIYADGAGSVYYGASALEIKLS